MFFFSERDPNSSIPPPVLGAFTPTVIGEEPPEFASVDDLCPSTPPCPDCAKMMHAIRCEGSARLYGLNVLPYKAALPGLPNRTSGRKLKSKTTTTTSAIKHFSKLSNIF